MWAAAVILLSSTVPAAAAPPERTAPAPTAEPRIISLVPSLTEAVCLLDACHLLVGVDKHSNWPERVQQLPQLGGLDETPVERVVSLRPDWVIAPAGSRVAARLQGLGLTVVSVPTQTHEDIQQALKLLGERLDRRRQAETLWQRALAQTAQARAALPAALQGQRVYVEVSPEPHAAGPGSFIGQTLQGLGLQSITPAAWGPFPRVNPEFVVREQPAVIIAPAAQFDAMAQRPGWKALPALQRRHCALAPSAWEIVVRPGPRLGDAAQILSQCLSQHGR